MIKAEKPVEEALRLQALHEYKVLDTLTEREFDDLTKIASFICQTPVALITLIGEDRQWHKSRIGTDIQQVPRDLAFCSHTILSDETMIVTDFTKDVRFHDHPLVIEGPCARFYAGAPLITPSGMRIGSLCVLDFAPRELSSDQIEALESLARQVVVLLEMRLSLTRLEESRLAAVEATNEANRAVKIKTEFLANISHEIRTPMNGIIGMTQVMLDGNVQPEDRGRVEIIRDCGRTLLSLINDILDFSKLESGNVEFESQPFDLHAAARGTIELFKPLAAQKNLDIELSIDPEMPNWYAGDVTRVTQVLTNLLSNAIKFTSSGKIEVTIDSLIESLSSGHHLVHVTVKDSGIGIPVELQDRLFLSFSQVDASITRRFGGTGLGLAICRSLCENMGGR
ncbi:MAG: hybrid sensor histidine kinase/response regulator, partial [Proteobacteria bacterium]